MAEELSLEAIQKQQDEVTKVAAEYEKTRDPDEIESINQRLAVEVEKLKSIAQDFADQLAAQYEEEYGISTSAEIWEGGQEPMTEVKLTEGQQAHVLAETGLDLKTILLPDPGGMRSQIMPYTDPDEIEMLALAYARHQKNTAETLEATQESVNKALKDFEDNASPEAMVLLEKMKEDPDFLAGMVEE